MTDPVRPLQGLRVIEISAFTAAPLAGVRLEGTLAAERSRGSDLRWMPSVHPRWAPAAEKFCANKLAIADDAFAQVPTNGVVADHM